MIITEKMEYVSAIVLVKDVDSVTKALLDLGVVEFSVEREKQELGTVRRYRSEEQYRKLQELRKRCSGFLEMAGLPNPDASKLQVAQQLPDLPIAKIESLMNEISVQINQLRDRQRLAQQRISELQIMKKRLGQTQDNTQVVGYQGQIPVVYASGLQQKLTQYTAVAITHNNIDKLGLEIIVNRQESADLMKLLQRYKLDGLQEFVPATSEHRALFIKEIEQDIASLQEEQAKVKEEIHQGIIEQAQDLNNYWLALRAHELYGEIQGQFKATNTTVVFSGWVPSSVYPKVVERLREVTQRKVIIKNSPAKPHSGDAALQPPTKLKNNAFSRPYELLVNTYGVVQYGHVDPTFMVSIFFTLMFGLMFADVGQGALVFLLGIFLLIKNKKEVKTASSLGSAGAIVAYCGASAMVFGVLFGSYFGLQLFPPVWFDLHGIAMTGAPHHITQSSVRSIGDIFALSFQFGFVVLGVGILFNFINKIRTKQYFTLVFSEGGLLGVSIYVIATHMVWHYVSQGSLASYPFITTAPWVLVVLALLFFIIPIHHTLEHNKEHKSKLRMSQVLAWPAIWLFELFELTSRYFSSTLSFVRIGAIGIVHAVLMGVFYSMAANAPHIILSILIVLFVNVLVIGLEGMLAAVNSMRLHFYEFFSRYFEAGGRLYQPITLKSE